MEYPEYKLGFNGTYKRFLENVAHVISCEECSQDESILMALLDCYMPEPFSDRIDPYTIPRDDLVFLDNVVSTAPCDVKTDEREKYRNEFRKKVEKWETRNFVPA